MVSQCIYAQRERERFIALTVIEFLAYSRERVLLSRIEHLLSRHSEPQGNRKFARGADEITQACRGLVIYDAKFEVLHFNHPCVNEYLEDVLDPRFAHAWIAELCLRELLGSASLVSKSPDTSPPTVRESTEFLTVREFPPYAAKHWFYHARHSIRAHEFDNAERQFLQDPLAVQAWMRILDWSVTDAERRVCGYRMFFAFARAFPDSMGMLFLASYFVGDDEVCQTLSESLVLATAWGVRMPSFEHILSSIPWSRDFTQLSSLRQAAEACYGLTEREAKRRSGLSWCLMYATELYQLLAVLNDNHLGDAVLDIFIKECRPEALAALLKDPGVDINRQGRWGETPLITAVRLKHVDVANVLLRHLCIDLKACDDGGLTAGEIARRLDLEPLLRLFSTSTGCEELVPKENLSVVIVPHLAASLIDHRNGRV
ncbi:uncharacterized protein BDV14DRAFT_197678 [Aspergillus stella-maris]|uniref:uncharacterized protein n=1 Tax=Aspergillus stella-maris TaxID=1810926 RepID=UPI003CCE2EBF